jgi:hypothetical protein
MNYESYAQEWDATCEEMCKFQPELGDKVLCLTPEVQAGEVMEVIIKKFYFPRDRFYIVRLGDGTVDEFADEDVLKRKIEEVAV